MVGKVWLRKGGLRRFMYISPHSKYSSLRLHPPGHLLRQWRHGLNKSRRPNEWLDGRPTVTRASRPVATTTAAHTWARLSHIRPWARRSAAARRPCCSWAWTRLRSSRVLALEGVGLTAAPRGEGIGIAAAEACVMAWRCGRSCITGMADIVGLSTTELHQARWKHTGAVPRKVHERKT